MKKEILVHSSRNEALSCFEHVIRMNDGCIPAEDAEWIAEILDEIVPEGGKAFLAFYPIDEERWEIFSENNWKRVFRKRFQRRGLFGMSKSALWEVGYSIQPNFLGKAFKYAWDISANDTVMLFPAREDEIMFFFDEFEDDFEANPDNEKKIVGVVGTVISRGWDGYWANIYSGDYDTKAIATMIEEVSGKKVQLTDHL